VRQEGRLGVGFDRPSQASAAVAKTVRLVIERTFSHGSRGAEDRAAACSRLSLIRGEGEKAAYGILVGGAKSRSYLINTPLGIGGVFW
jgi:hypothetical protein